MAVSPVTKVTRLIWKLGLTMKGYTLLNCQIVPVVILYVMLRLYLAKKSAKFLIFRPDYYQFHNTGLV